MSDQPQPAEPVDAERRALELAEQYLDRLQAGDTPDRRELLDAYPDIAQLLDEQLRLVEVMHHVAHVGQVSNLPDNMVRPEPGSHSVPAERLDRYCLLDVLGRGASSTVYRAYDPRFDREIALKVLRQDRLPTADAAERFERDARIAAQLRHPHIVPLHEAGEHGGVCYIDMELVRGETLDARLRRGPLSYREGVELVEKMALALEYAHGLGIIHRDVKPSNILLDERGEPQLTDFGLARRDDGEATLTCEGQVLGTPQHMPPEQATGGARQADARSDVYSLGVVFYQLLTGRLPYPEAGDLSAYLYHIVHTDPAAPRSLNPRVPRDLETICLKALAKEPAERFATAGQFAEELGRWLRDESLHIRPPTRWERTRRWSRRNQLAAAVVAVATVLLLLVAGVLGGLALSAHRAIRLREILLGEVQTDRAQLKVQLAEIETKRAELEVQSLLEQARKRLDSLAPRRRQEALDDLRKIAEPWRRLPAGAVKDELALEARSQYVRSLSVLDSREIAAAELPDLGFEIWPVALHPDGQLVAIGAPDEPVRWKRDDSFSFPDRTMPASVQSTEQMPRLAFSPRGDALAFGPSHGGLELWDGGARQRLRILEARDAGRVEAIGFDAAGKTVWACHVNGRIASWLLPGGEPQDAWHLSAAVSVVTCAGFSSDGETLALADSGHRVHVFQGKRLISRLPSVGMQVDALAWSPDGRYLAVATRHGLIRVWERKGSSFDLLHKLTTEHVQIRRIVFSPDGRWLLTGWYGNPAAVWDVRSAKPIARIDGIPQGFARGGRRLATSTHRTVHLFDVLVPEGLETISGHEAAVVRLAWSRDNRRFVSLDSRFEVRTWQVGQSSEVDAFQAPIGGMFATNAAVALSDDSRFLAYASGEADQAQVLVRDVESHTTLGPWTLPGGYEQLAYSDGRFLSVREEKDPSRSVREPQSWPTRSVVYELMPGHVPRMLRVLRPSGAADVRSFLSHALSQDGRRYAWAGPRAPAAAKRLEIFDVLSSRQFMVREDNDKHQLFVRFLDAGGRFVVYRDGNERNWLYDLDGKEPAEELVAEPVLRWRSASGHFRLFAYGTRPNLLLKTDSHPEPGLLRFNGCQGDSAAFSPDGQYLAWGSPDGLVALADLPILREKIRVFEKMMRSK